MDPTTKARIAQEGGKLVGSLVRLVMAKPRKKPAQSGEEREGTEAPATRTPLVAQAAKPAPGPALPTREETTAELKRRLAKELYRAELDLAGGLKIAGKPCDCLSNKHTLGLEATAEELVSSDPGNPVYLEIIQWIKDNRPKVSIEAIESGSYAADYPQMASQFKDYRKRILGTAAFSAMGVPAQPITLEEAKKLAADEAEKEVEKRWASQEKK